MPAWRCGPTRAYSRRALARPDRAGRTARGGLSPRNPLDAAARDPRAAERTKYKALEAAGRRWARTSPRRVAVSFEANVNPAGIAQPACTGCGDCCGGCNVGAKNTVALTYLPDAVRHGAEIFTHANVRHVAKSCRRATGGCTSTARTRTAGDARYGPARRHGRAGGRHARLDRDPAALARQGLALSDRLGRALLRQRRHHRVRLRRQASRSTPSASATRPRSRARRRRSRFRPDRDRRRGRPRQRA